MHLFPRSFRRTVRIASAALVALIFTIDVRAGSPVAVPNPVLPNLADSGVMRYNGEYYIIGNWIAGHMFSSEDLLSWGNRTHVFSMDNRWATGPAGRDREIHACDIRYVNGVFHLYWSVNRADIVRAIGHATTTGDPLSFYHEPIKDRPFSEKIDPHLFIDDEGSHYFYTTKFPPGLGNVIFGQRMDDPWTLSGPDVQLLTPAADTWETRDAEVNEAPWVLRYRDWYYMLYNANHTRFPGYAIGVAAQNEGPLAFRNAHKYPRPVLERISRNGHRITHTGQPSVVRGPNGFEWWIVYFASYDGGPRSIGIDRLLFFDRTLHVDGPTSLATATGTTFSPPPAPATFRDLFSRDSSLGDSWEIVSGDWETNNERARQINRRNTGLALAQTPAARNYLVETDLKIEEGTEGLAGLVAFYQEPDTWLAVGLDAASGAWRWIRKRNGLETSQSYPLPDGFDPHVFRNLRIEKNHDRFHVWIDGRPAPGNPIIDAGFNGVGRPGMATREAGATFDGFVHTLGWDEYDGRIRGWENPEADGGRTDERWTVTDVGITSPETGVQQVFKGDFLHEYEFMTQVTIHETETTRARMGIRPVYIDAGNHLTAILDLSSRELVLTGMRNGAALPEERLHLSEEKTSYNLRAIKRVDGTRIYVDGILRTTLPGSQGPSRVGLLTDNTRATFNGITLIHHPSVTP